MPSIESLAVVAGAATPEKFTQRHRARLRRMAMLLDAKEIRYQGLYGERMSGSMRSSDMLDAKAIRAAIAALEGTGQA
jgi:hypothetical protein